MTLLEAYQYWKDRQRKGEHLHGEALELVIDGDSYGWDEKIKESEEDNDLLS